MIRAAAIAVAALVICTAASAAQPGTRLVWTARLSAPVGTPAVADGHIYVATGAVHTRLHALDAVTGRRLWQAIGGRGTLYAPLAAPGLVFRLSNLDTVRRYDPATGRVFWKRTGPFAEGFLAQPALAGDRVVELSDSLTVLDRNGKQLWVAPDDCFRCQTATDGTHIYAAGKQGLRSFDAATGKVLWTAKSFGLLDTVSSTTLAGNVVIVVSTGQRPHLYTFYLEGFRASDGRALWHTKLEDTDGFDPFAAPVASGGLVVYPTVDGHLFALDTQTGALRWRADIGNSDSTPAVGDGVWIVEGDNRLHKLDLATGASLWAGPPMAVRSNAATPSPVIDGSLVLVGTAAGNLLAFG